MASEAPKMAPADIPLNSMLTFRLSRLHLRLNAQAARILKESSGLSLMQWRVFVMLETVGQIAPSEMVRRTGFDKGQLSRVIKGMIKEGLVRSVSSESDQRLHLIDITEKGAALFEQARPHMRSRQNHLLDSLTDSERAAIFKAMDKLELAMEELED
ncbi:MAG: MarR family transcriptional regulator [Rhodobacteraceae bacterium]|nr:MarR family transcriptional regulator [Paracoccaceae bacterium]